MNFIRRNIPNAITCGNLICGCLAIVKAFEGDLVWAAYLVGIAAVFDFFDGFVARALKVSSPIGKDLDSLADMVTFGVVPGVVMFKLLQISVGINWTIHPPLTTHNTMEFGTVESFLPYLAFLISVFSAIRLAKFNNDTRQSDSFIGVPTPANAIFICSIALIICTGSFYSDGPQEIYPVIGKVYELHGDTVLFKILMAPVFLSIITVVLSFLLVSELPLIALKFKHFKWKGNEIRFIFLAGSVLLLALLQLTGIPLVIVFYILISIINNILTKQKAKLPD